MDTIKISLYALLNSISNAQDLVSPNLSSHHQQVAYLSYKLAKELKLPIEVQKDIFLAGLVHDIGALSKNERLEIIETEPIYINNHAFVGAKLLEDFKPMQDAARMIKYHHLAWNNGKGSLYQGDDVPIGSHIIHLADRVCTMILKNHNILSQIPRIIEYMNHEANSLYDPQITQALAKLGEKRYIWLDLISNFPANKVNIKLFNIVELDIHDITELALIFSHIIDFRSSFTSLHSAGVAKIAEQLAKLSGFSQQESSIMLIAGYLHDLGKLAIDSEILEKPSKLSEDEFNQIRSHTYYTYQLLDSIPQFQLIKEWASYHHERIDGKGYPFHIGGDDLSLGSRIMAVADVFTAITEKRPYRDGMDDNQTTEILYGMVESGALDKKIVNILFNNFEMIKDLRKKSQQDATIEYEKFLHI